MGISVCGDATGCSRLRSKNYQQLALFLLEDSSFQLSLRLLHLFFGLRFTQSHRGPAAAAACRAFERAARNRGIRETFHGCTGNSGESSRRDAGTEAQ